LTFSFRFPLEAGWKIVDLEGDMIKEVVFGTYNKAFAITHEGINLNAVFNYTFSLLDSYSDGQNGRAIIYLGVTADDNQIIGYYDSELHSFEEEYNIAFQASEAGIVTLSFPTGAPSFSPSNGPSAIPSNALSLEPTSPTSSLVPTLEEIDITIEIQLDNYTSETGWKIIDIEGKTNLEAPPGTYRERYSTVYTEIKLGAGFDYFFIFFNAYEDGQNGRAIIYLGTSADESKIVGYYDHEYHSFVNEYVVSFLASEDGILAGIFPSASPSDPLPLP